VEGDVPVENVDRRLGLVHSAAADAEEKSPHEIRHHQAGQGRRQQDSQCRWPERRSEQPQTRRVDRQLKTHHAQPAEQADHHGEKEEKLVFRQQRSGKEAGQPGFRAAQRAVWGRNGTVRSKTFVHRAPLWRYLATRARARSSGEPAPQAAAASVSTSKASPATDSKRSMSRRRFRSFAFGFKLAARRARSASSALAGRPGVGLQEARRCWASSKSRSARCDRTSAERPGTYGSSDRTERERSSRPAVLASSGATRRALSRYRCASEKFPAWKEARPAPARACALWESMRSAWRNCARAR